MPKRVGIEGARAGIVPTFWLPVGRYQLRTAQSWMIPVRGGMEGWIIWGDPWPSLRVGTHPASVREPRTIQRERCSTTARWLRVDGEAMRAGKR